MVRTNLADAFDTEFDVVAFNPPYLPDTTETPDDRMDDALSGGETGVEVAVDLVADLPRLLDEDGDALILASSLADVERLRREAERRGFDVDEAGRDRFFFEEIVVLRLQR